jgi:putative tryptophan/tyrosine transport system substrate-binding protein
MGQMAIGIGRRQFIAALGGATIALPLAARAQQPGKLPTIGYLGITSSIESQRVAAFVQQLRELGWRDGRNVAIEYRWTEGRNDRAAEIAAEFVRLKADVIVAVGTPAALAAKQATSVIPVVFTSVGDPVGAGLVASLARPGGNVTGLSIQQPELAGKRLGLLRDVVPGLGRLAMMADGGNPANVLEIGEVQAAAHTLGLDVAVFDIRRVEDIEAAFAKLKGRADALYVTGDPLLSINVIRINTLALAARLPTMDSSRENLEGGGLMSYGPNFADLHRRAAGYVDKILRGAKPANLPVEQPTKFEFIINLKTAKALGLTIPQSMLLLADEVIE